MMKKVSLEKLREISNIDVYIRLLSYVKDYWFALIIAILGNVLYSAVDAAFTYLLKPVLDKGFIARDTAFIHWLPVLTILIFILRSLGNYLGTYYMALISRNIIMRFRQEMFAKLMRLPSIYYNNSTTGEILSKIIYNVEQVAQASADSLTDMLQSGVFIVGLLIVMFSISWRLSLLYFITIPVIAVTVTYSTTRTRRLMHGIQKNMGEVTSIAEEAVEGYKVVRAFGGENYETEKFRVVTEKNRRKELKLVITKAISASSIQFIAAAVLAITIYLATSHAHITRLSAGGFVSLIAAMLALLKPLKIINRVNTKIQRGIAGAHSVFALLDEEEEKDNGKITVNRVQGNIQYEKLTFIYPRANKPALDNISVNIRAGQTIALVGQSGSGKSTLISLLLRFYDYEQGKITIDGVDIRDYRLTDLRNQFAIVSQDVTLFNDTVARNIAYGKFDQVSETEIIQAAEAAYAWDFIQQLPQGLATKIGEDGVLLSGGQRQRIAIARAIVKNAPLLILDEATSALDTESERHIQAALDELRRDRTSLVIAHRLSTVEHADNILVLHEGKLVEQGTHAELLSLNGYYSRLYNLQFKQHPT